MMMMMMMMKMMMHGDDDLDDDYDDEDAVAMEVTLMIVTTTTTMMRLFFENDGDGVDDFNDTAVQVSIMKFQIVYVYMIDDLERGSFRVMFPDTNCRFVVAVNSWLIENMFQDTTES